MRKLIIFSALIFTFNAHAKRGGDFSADAAVQGQIYHQEDSQVNTVNRNNNYNGYVGVGNTGSVLVNPAGGYYSRNCNNIQVCNPNGHCWMQQSCN